MGIKESLRENLAPRRVALRGAILKVLLLKLKASLKHRKDQAEDHLPTIDDADRLSVTCTHFRALAPRDIVVHLAFTQESISPRLG